MTLTQAVEYFIIDQRLKGNTEKTVRGYQDFLKRFVEWLALKNVIDISDLTLARINEYQLYIDAKPSERGGNEKLTKRTVQTYMRHIKIFISFCFSEAFISEAIHLKMKTPKSERPVIEILTDDEVSVILSCFTKSETGLRNTAIILVMLDCGLRLEEFTRIKSNHINFEKGYMKVIGKGRKERIVPLGLKVRKSLLAYLYKRRMADSPEDDQYFFLTDRRKRMTTSCISSLMGRLKKFTDISRLHAHLFRHTFATNFLVNNIGDVYELSRLLGHSELRTTEQYLQLASYYTIIEKKRRISYLDMKM